MLEIGVVNLGAVVELDVDVWLVNVLWLSKCWICCKVCSLISPGTWGVRIKPDFSEQATLPDVESLPCLFVARHS